MKPRHVHDRREGGQGEPGADHPGGGRRGGHLHPAAVRLQGPRAARQLPRLHGAGQRPPPGGLHADRSREGMVVENDTAELLELPAQHHRHALRRGQPLLHVLREERQLRAAGAGLPLRHRGPEVPVPVPEARRRRFAPGRLHRPQPLHPVRPLRAGLAGPGRQERLPLRRARARSKRLQVNARRARRTPTSRRPTRRSPSARWARSMQEARRLRGPGRAAAVRPRSPSARTSRRSREEK